MQTQTAPAKLLKTNAKQYVANWESYIADCIAVDGDESGTLLQKLEYAAQRFVSEYSFPDNVRRYPNLQQRLAEYLAGLPFGFAFNHGDIIEAAARLHGVASFSEKQADMIRLEWFRHCALMLLKVAERHGVDFGTGYVVRWMPSFIDSDGLRRIIGPQQGRCTHDTKKQAQAWIDAMLRNNNHKMLSGLYGDLNEIQASPVRCHPVHHDPVGVYV